MKITIYQIIPELDQDRLMFMPLSYFQKAGYPSPPAEIYESVFCGETEVATLEEIYRIFNRKDEANARYLEKIGFTGHSMSVSDWHIWRMAGFLFIPVSRFSSSAGNTVSASSDTGSVTRRRKSPLGGSEIFWSVQLSFCLRIRKGRLRKIYGITALNLRLGSCGTLRTAR